MHDEEGRVKEGITPIDLAEHVLEKLDEFLHDVSHQRDSEPLGVGDQCLMLGDLRDLSTALFGLISAAKYPNTELRWRRGVWGVERESTEWTA